MLTRSFFPRSILMLLALLAATWWSAPSLAQGVARRNQLAYRHPLAFRATHGELQQCVDVAVLIGGQFDKAADYIVGGDGYLQHNPQIGDGLAALGAAFGALAEAGTPVSYARVHRTVAEGNFVFLMSEGAIGQTPTAFFDLFRVEDGRIVEHWDVVSPIPSEMAHDNGKF